MTEQPQQQPPQQQPQGGGYAGVVNAAAAAYSLKAAFEWHIASVAMLAFLVSALRRRKPADISDDAVTRTAQQAYSGALTRSSRLVTAAWDDSYSTVEKSVLEAVGASKGKRHPTDVQVLEKLLGDLKANADVAAQKIADALKEDQGTDEAKKVLKDLERRAAMTADVAAKTAATQAFIETGEAVGVTKKRWMSVLGPTTCEHCRNLHGMVVGLHQEFPHTTGKRTLKVYGERLFGPPRHPNCRCWLEPVL